jgi:hypothetical protein
MKRYFARIAAIGLMMAVITATPICTNLAAAQTAKSPAYTTTVAYVTEFYPLWFTFNQTRLVTDNQLVGPVRISPIYRYVVAINDDTLYASTYANVADQPLVVTIPTTSVTYSILTLDAYGDIFETGIASGTPGTYALTGPGWTGTLPPGVIPIPVPVNFFALIFRADKFSNNVDQTELAEIFRTSLKAQVLSNYMANPKAGGTKIRPEILFFPSFKLAADSLIANHPVTFLKQLQQAVASSNTPTLSAEQALLSETFNGLFNEDESNPDFAAGAQAALALIVQVYQTHTGSTNWTNFQDIGAWGDHVIERSSITEFCQFCNGRKTAAYFHAFKDSNGDALDGSNPKGYVLTFSAQQLPQAARFWSVTAYTPDTIELIRNPANKYVVASYTPGLVTNNGSVSIFIAQQLPPGAPEPNWLPVSSGPFNIMLRVYGPQGTVTQGLYIPPAIVPVQ